MPGRSLRTFAVHQLDRKLPALQRAAAEIRSATPQKGWLSSLRHLLGMSNRAAAERLGISHPTLLNLERSEQSGSITLNSLRKVAEALDGELVYAIVPRRKLSDMIAERAREVARKQIVPIAKTMALEDQGISAAQIERQIADLARELEEKPRELWR